MISFLGLNDDLKYLEGEQKQSLKVTRQEGVMDKLTENILSIDLSAISLSSDTQLAANAQKFEQLKNKVDAFLHLSKGAASYFKKRGEKIKNEVEKKLRKIKLICEYYDIRKEIIRDPYYSTHYNSELSMQAGKVDQNQEPEKYELSKKLLKSYYLGLVLSDEHLGGNASMEEISPFKDTQSQMIREDVKKDVLLIRNTVMSTSVTYVYSKEKSVEHLKSGVRESTRKRWAHSNTIKKYGEHLKNVAQQAVREGRGTTSEKDMILSSNRFGSIPEEKEGEDEDD